MKPGVVEWLNALPADKCREVLAKCCGAGRWVNEVSASRPWADEAALLAAAEQTFHRLGEHDWLEAFAHHPKIGDVDSLRRRFASTANWTSQEQKGAAVAEDSVLQALADGNREYEERNGFIFIVCATGKSAVEMLDILRARLGNSRSLELEKAAGEQRKITAIRLDKLEVEP